MSQTKVMVFGQCLVVLDEPVAQRYAQAIREGMWQCNITQEPWKDGRIYMSQMHTCDANCCDSRTDDEVGVERYNPKP